MDEKSNKRDTLATIEVVVRMISLLLIPVLMWILGTWYNTQQKQREESRIKAENTANHLYNLLKNLSSDKPRERKMAVVISTYLGRQGQVPLDLVTTLAGIAATDSNQEVSNAAGLSLKAVANSGKEQAPAAKAILNELPSRIYIHIPEKNQMNLARQITGILTGNGYQVPGIEIVSMVISNSQLRYFHENDKTEAEKIVSSLREKGHHVIISFVKGYENKVRPRQFEIWISGQ
jgi:hypothetical protein